MTRIEGAALVKSKVMGMSPDCVPPVGDVMLHDRLSTVKFAMQLLWLAPS